MAKSATIGSLRIALGLDSTQFQAGVAKVGTSMDALAKKAAMFGAAVGAAMTAAAGAMSVAIGNVISKADQLGDVADRLGVSVTALQELRHAAERSGMAVQNFDVALRRFIRRSAEAALGTGAAKTAFQQLGISLRDAQGNLKPTEDLLNEVADAMQRVPTQADRLRLAFQMFDTDGAAMLNLLQEGSAGVNRLREEARSLGIVLSDETVRGAKAFSDNLAIINKAKDGLIMRLTAHLLPALENLSEQFVRLVNDGARMETLSSALNTAFEWLAHSAMRITAGIQGMRAELSGLGSAIAAITDGEGGLLKRLANARDAWNAGQNEAAKIIADMEARIATGVFNATSQGQIQRRISAAFGDAGAKAGEDFALNFEKATKEKIKIDPLAQEGAQIMASVMTPLERYRDTIANLNILLDQGAIDQETYNRAVIQAQDAFAKAEAAGKKTESVFEDIARTMASSFSGAFTSIIDGSRKVGDVIEGLLKQLASMLMNRAFQSIINALIPGSGSGLGYFPPAPIPGFASGTKYAPGGMALVGERGPELVNLPRGSQVIPNHKLGEGGGGLRVHVDVTQVPGARAEVNESQDGLQVRILPQVLGAVAEDVAKGGIIGRQIQSSFGLRRRTV